MEVNRIVRFWENEKVMGKIWLFVVCDVMLVVW